MIHAHQLVLVILGFQEVQVDLEVLSRLLVLEAQFFRFFLLVLQSLDFLLVPAVPLDRVLQVHLQFPVHQVFQVHPVVLFLLKDHLFPVFQVFLRCPSGLGALEVLIDRRPLDCL